MLGTKEENKKNQCVMIENEEKVLLVPLMTPPPRRHHCLQNVLSCCTPVDSHVNDDLSTAVRVSDEWECAKRGIGGREGVST